MSVAPSSLGTGQLAAGTAAIMMTPATAAMQLTSVVFANTNGVPEAITVYLVPSGGAPGPGNIIISALTIPIAPPYVSPELRGRNLNIGDALFGFATDGGVVNFWIDGNTIA